MTFFDLPPDWRHRPLTNQTLATNVADLYCTAGDRSRGTLTLIICDEKNHFKGAIAIDLQDLLPDPPTPSTPAGGHRKPSHPSPNAAADGRRRRSVTPAVLPRSSIPGAVLPGSPTAPGAILPGPAATAATLRGPSRSTRRAAALRPVIRPLQVYPGGALLLTLGRRGPSATTTSDREWAEAATRACRSLGVRLLGFYVASRDTVFPADLTTAPADLPTAA
ncbi:hypothetical protein [Kribbella lupini]|uniref:Uncharacterized protein n=1 Tax=Kribbella lupini TaxID=291602 RepID=A0ABP4LHR2_9ACTN